jgi:hypothetical protein
MVIIIPTKPLSTLPTKPLLPLLRQQQPILHPTTPLQHIRILTTLVPLTTHIRTSQLELLRQTRLARPLHVLRVVVRSLVRAAHHIDAVELAHTCRPHALQLRDGGDAAGGRLLAGADGEGGDFGEQDGIAGYFGGIGDAGGEGGVAEEQEEEGGDDGGVEGSRHVRLGGMWWLFGCCWTRDAVYGSQEWKVAICW